MGILNITPDSFSDGGDFLNADAALREAEQMIEWGADVVDIGGESTRPFAKPVPPEEELARVLPIVRVLVNHGIRQLSIDTRNASTARACFQEGVTWLNDVSAFTHDPLMIEAAKNFETVILMHSRGTPESMQAGNIAYDDVVSEVYRFLQERVQVAMYAGIEKSKLIVDPGIGFGKRLEHNLALIRSLSKFQGLGSSVLCGLSRKAFIGELTGLKDPKERDAATIGAICMASSFGADIVRVHDVKGAVHALKIVDALRQG